MFYYIFRMIIYYLKLYIIGSWCVILQIFTERKKNEEFPLQTGKVAIVTGGGEGIGFYVSKKLVSRNVHVIIGGKCRDVGKNAIEEIRKDFPNAKVDYIHVDLASLKSVKEFAESFLSRNLPLHFLINNAGIMIPPYQCTQDGCESQHQVNFLSHFYLTQLLLDRLVQSGAPEAWSRIVNVSSSAHYAGWPDLENLTNRIKYWYEYSSHKAYSDSKLLIVAAANMLDGQLRANQAPVSVCCVHPGVVRTNLFRHISPVHVPVKQLIEQWTFLSPEQGAETTLFAALSPEVEGQSGCYYDNCKKTMSASLTYDEDFQKKVWTQSTFFIENTVIS